MNSPRDDDLSAEDIRRPYRSGLESRRLPLPLRLGVVLVALVILTTFTWIGGAFENTLWGRL